MVDQEVSPHIRIADILEQLGEIDKMIVFHKKNSPDDSMLKQYQFMEKQFMKELTLLLKQYNIQVLPIRQRTRKERSSSSKAYLDEGSKKVRTPASQSSRKS